MEDRWFSRNAEYGILFSSEDLKYRGRSGSNNRSTWQEPAVAPIQKVVAIYFDNRVVLSRCTCEAARQTPHSATGFDLF